MNLLQLYSNKPTATLYHYTSLGSLEAILASRSLYASDIRFASDASELAHVATLIEHEVARRLESAPSLAEARFLTQLRRWAGHRLKDGHMLFVASFTANGNLLSQWRGYCRHGKGLSLGFQASDLLQSGASLSFEIGECVYEASKQNEIIVALFQEIWTRAVERGENHDRSKRHPDDSYFDVFESFEECLLKIAVLMKHPSFKEEAEWRAVSPVKTNYVEEPIEYREGRSMLVPFIRFPLPTRSDGPVALHHVVLGPTPHNNQSMESLSRFLARRGSTPATGIRSCGIPYREP